MRKLQLEIPKLSKQTDYQFPYWSLNDRVVGQPVFHFKEKYDATYKRVANTMIQAGSYEFRALNLLGLFATNHRTIGDYLQFQFKTKNLSVPQIKEVIVIERSKEVCDKILTKESQVNKKVGNLTLLPTLLKNLTYIPGFRGQPPDQAKEIKQIQEKFLKKINFIDIDLMCNWGSERKLTYISKLINMFAAPFTVVHINAISNFPRTPGWAKSKQEIEDILLEKVIKSLNGKVSNLSINSYITCSRVRTEMTSAVLLVENK